MITDIEMHIEDRGKLWYTISWKQMEFMGKDEPVMISTISAEEANEAFKKLGEALTTIQKCKRNNEAFYKDSIGGIHDV